MPVSLMYMTRIWQNVQDCHIDSLLRESAPYPKNEARDSLLDSPMQCLQRGKGIRLGQSRIRFSIKMTGARHRRLGKKFRKWIQKIILQRVEVSYLLPYRLYLAGWEDY